MHLDITNTINGYGVFQQVGCSIGSCIYIEAHGKQIIRVTAKSFLIKEIAPAADGLT